MSTSIWMRAAVLTLTLWWAICGPIRASENKAQALKQAVENRNLQRVDELLASGTYPDSEIFGIAAYRCDLEMFDKLLDAGANPKTLTFSFRFSVNDSDCTQAKRSMIARKLVSAGRVVTGESIREIAKNGKLVWIASFLETKPVLDQGTRDSLISDIVKNEDAFRSEVMASAVKLALELGANPNPFQYIGFGKMSNTKPILLDYLSAYNYAAKSERSTSQPRRGQVEDAYKAIELLTKANSVVNDKVIDMAKKMADASETKYHGNDSQSRQRYERYATQMTNVYRLLAESYK